MLNIHQPNLTYSATLNSPPTTHKHRHRNTNPHSGHGAHQKNPTRCLAAATKPAAAAAKAAVAARAAAAREVAAPPSLPPLAALEAPRLLFDLPESIDTVVARFLRVKQALLLTSTCSRLHLPQASQLWYVSERLSLNWHPDLHRSTLASLLRRLPGAAKIRAGYDQIIYPLAMAGALGLCQNLCEVHIGGRTTGGTGGRVMGEMSIHALDCLGTAIGAGSMPALQMLKITQDFEKGGAQALLRCFWNGTSPHLHSFEVSIIYSDEIGGSDAEEGDYYRDYEVNEKETRKNAEALAVMLDKRRRLGYCVGLKILPDGWMEFGSASARMRILRCTLGTLGALNFADEKLDDADCAGLVEVLESEEVLVPQTKGVGFYGAFRGLDGATRVFHAMGKTTAFKSVQYLAISQDNLTTEAFYALMSTLKSDALPSLEILSLKGTSIASDVLATLLEGLEQSACAHKLRELDLSKFGICAESAKALSLAIERDFLPSLRTRFPALVAEARHLQQQARQRWGELRDTGPAIVLPHQAHRSGTEICRHG